MNAGFNNKCEMSPSVLCFMCGKLSHQPARSGTYFVKNRKKDYIKILSIRDANIISLSENQYEIGKQFGAVICLFGQTHMEFDKKMKL